MACKGPSKSLAFPRFTFVGMSWVLREFNKQADVLCHVTLGRKTEWRDVAVQPAEFELQAGDLIAGWSDGGFDRSEGGTAAYIINVKRDGLWTCLVSCGIFDGMTSNNDAFRMEAIGMELFIKEMMHYAVR